MSSTIQHNGFDLWSPIYDLTTFIVFMGGLQNATRDWLKHSRNYSSILILGGGSGWYLKDMVCDHTDTRIDFVDSSEKMLALAAARLKSLPKHKVKLIQSNATTLSSEVTYDLVIAFFFLDMFTPATIQALIRKFSATHKTSGPDWLVLDFCYPEKFPMRQLGYGLIAFMYFIFRISCQIEAKQLYDINQYFNKYGFSRSSHKFYCKGLIEGQLFTKP